MRRNYIAVVALIVASVWTTGANAQCADAVCNRSAHHWNFSNLVGGGWNVIVGMMQIGNVFKPMICAFDAGSGKFILSGSDSNNFQYATRQLSDDTSMCGTSAADKIQRIDRDTTCFNGRNPALVAGTLLPFSNASHVFRISGGAGNDTIDLRTNEVDGAHALCGGFGNDRIIGSAGPDYINGGHDHDFLWGSGGSDNVRGTTGGDVIHHFSDAFAPEGNDLLRGEAGVDCINARSGAHVAVGSSCGEDNDYDVNQQVDSCNLSTTDCCLVSDAC
jgi:Ca2+-binding RTX toxin-like protein